MKPAADLKTINEFMDWCKANPNLKIHTLSVEAYEIVDDWRWAVAMNSTLEVANAATPGTILIWVDNVVKLLGKEVLDDIQRTFDGR